jgi:hypothetical protein
MPRVTGFDPIAYLVKRKYPLFGIPPMRLRSSDKSGSPRTSIEEAEAYRASLESKPSQEIDHLVMEERRAEIEETKRRLDAEERGRFFHQPHARADFDHYCKCSYWTVDEAVALSFGKNPEVVNWKTIAPLVGVSTFAREYSLRRDLATRAVYSQQLFERMFPTTFLTWARQTGIPVNADLANRAVASGISLKGWRDLYEDLVAKRKEDQKELARLQMELSQAQQQITVMEQKATEAAASGERETGTKQLATRERENLQLIAFLGAVKGYGYDPERKNDAAGKIEADTDKLSLRFTDDRIRHHLTEGFSLMPGDWRVRLGLKPNSANR